MNKPLNGSLSDWRPCVKYTIPISVRIRCASVLKWQRDWGGARYCLAITDPDDLRAAHRRAARRGDREARRSDAADRRDEPPAGRGCGGSRPDPAELSAGSRHRPRASLAEAIVEARRDASRDCV